MRVMILLVMILGFGTIFVKIANSSGLIIEGTYSETDPSSIVYSQLDEYISTNSDTYPMTMHKRSVMTFAYQLWCQDKYYGIDHWNSGLRIWANIVDIQDVDLFKTSLLKYDNGECWDGISTKHSMDGGIAAAQSMLIAATLYSNTRDQPDRSVVLLRMLEEVK